MVRGKTPQSLTAKVADDRQKVCRTTFERKVYNNSNCKTIMRTETSGLSCN